MSNTKKIKLVGKNIHLRPVRVSDATKEYVEWLNSPEINQYLEIRFTRHTLKNVKEYIKKVSKDRSFIFLAIIRKDSGKHIGNIKLGPINEYHKRAEIGIMIGDKNSWGRGFAGEAIHLLTNFAFNRLKLRKVIAGAYENNIGSIKTFIKNGFIAEAIMRDHWFSGGKWVSEVFMSKLNDSGRKK